MLLEEQPEGNEEASSAEVLRGTTLEADEVGQGRGFESGTCSVCLSTCKETPRWSWLMNSVHLTITLIEEVLIGLFQNHKRNAVPQPQAPMLGEMLHVKLQPKNNIHI